MPPFAEGQSGWGNMAIPDPNNDIDVSAQYPIETVLRIGGRAWRYTRIGDIDADTQTYNIRRGLGLESEACVNSYLGTALVSVSGFNTLGDFKVKLNMTTHVNYLGSASSVAVNDYAGGHFTIYDTSTGNHWGCMIVGNTVEDASGYVEITLESPLPTTLAADDYIMLEEGMYWKAHQPGITALNHSAVVGFPCIWAAAKMIAGGESVSDGEFIWLQTWGPFEGVIQGRAYGGAAAERYQSLSGSGYPNENSGFHEQPGGWYTACNYVAGVATDFDYNYLSSFFITIAP